MSIRILTLGGLTVLRDGAELTELLRQRMRCALLVHVAVERRVTRDDLVPLFWPERETERARHSLSQALYELRQDLGADVVESVGDLVAIGPGVEVDALELQEHVEHRRWTEALALYRGPFLAGTYLAEGAGWQSWVDRWRSRVDRVHRRARSAELESHRASNHVSEALAVARAWVEYEPLDDEARHLLIELLAASGRRSQALQQFAEYEALLARELDIEPLEQTRALVARIRGGEPAPNASARANSPDPASAVGFAPVADGGWTEDELIEELAPGLRVLRQVGRGSMAVVYLAREEELRRDVALKVLRPELARDTTSRLRFEREAQSSARVSHPNVATVFSVGALSTGAPFMVMEHVEGRNLAEHRALLGRMDAAQVRRVLTEVARALAAAHAKGIVHRDVRPENVLIEDASGRAVLTDFGLAALLEADDAGPRLTRTGEIVGNPIYLSPEQLVGSSVTSQADVYSLGMLAFDILTTTTQGRDPMALAQLRSSGARIAEVRDDVDAGLARLVERCLAPLPQDRPVASEIVAGLESTGELDDSAGSPPGLGSALRGFWRRAFPGP